MMEAVMWALSQAIKVLGVIGAWYLFKAIVTGGSGTIKDLIDTAELGIQAGCYHLKRMFITKIKKERNPEPIRTEEGSVE